MPGAVKGSKQHRMTVVPHRPWQRATLWLSAAIILTALLLIAYRTGFERGAANLAELDLAHSQGLSDVQRSARRVAELQAALSAVERNRQVDEQVNAQAQASIVALRSEIATLERDVSLYRQVMALEAETPSLSLQSWQLFGTELPDHFRYRLTLAFTGGDGDELTGQLGITVTGVSALDDLQGPDSDVEHAVEVFVPVRLRYLQVLEGDLRLPSDFTANHVKLDLNADPSSTFSFSESMPWQPEGVL